MRNYFAYYLIRNIKCGDIYACLTYDSNTDKYYTVWLGIMKMTPKMIVIHIYDKMKNKEFDSVHNILSNKLLGKELFFHNKDELVKYMSDSFERGHFVQSSNIYQHQYKHMYPYINMM